MFSFQLHPLPRGRGGEIGSCVFFLNSLHPLRVAEAAARVRRSKTRFDVLGRRAHFFGARAGPGGISGVASRRPGVENTCQAHTRRARRAVVRDSEFEIRTNVVRELLRGARQHLTKFVPELQNNLLEQAQVNSQVGLGHAFSRCKVKAPS